MSVTIHEFQGLCVSVDMIFRILLPHTGSFVTVKKISEKKMFKKMLYGNICVYYLILMIFVSVYVCRCVCMYVCVCVCVCECVSVCV